MSTPPPLITLTTDFGNGPFAELVKGVILGIYLQVRLVDLCHDIPPQDVRAAGALVLEQALRVFPSGSVHLAVVDPGVGTQHRLLVVEALNMLFVLPNNVLFTPVRRADSGARLFALNKPRYYRQPVRPLPQPRHLGPRGGVPGLGHQSREARHAPPACRAFGLAARPARPGRAVGPGAGGRPLRQPADQPEPLGGGGLLGRSAGRGASERACGRGAEPDLWPGPIYLPMLKLKNLQGFRQIFESDGWADAFRYAEEDLQLEMLGLIEELLDSADVADKLVGEMLFNEDGIAAGQGAVPLKEE